MEIVRRWNVHLDDAGIPYLIRANLMSSAGTVEFYALSYEIVAETRATAGSTEHRVRFLRRVDRVNLREWYMGMVREQEDGVIIILDTVSAFAMNDVWPLLDPSADVAPLGKVHATFATAVAREAAAQLPEEHAEILRDTAPVRLSLLAAMASVRQRQACGSRFRMGSAPWNGFNDEELEPMRAARNFGSASCPAITVPELSAIEDASRTLRTTEGLRPAVEALAAWTTRPLAIHEARHAADQRDAKTDRARPCRWCDPYASDEGRQELSAYLAELAWSDSPAMALLQACHATTGDPGVGHGEAVDAIAARTDHDCAQGELVRANEIAGELEVDAFGRSDPIELSEDFPARLPVDELRLDRSRRGWSRD